MVPWTFQALSDVLTPVIYASSQMVAIPFAFGSALTIVSIAVSLILHSYTSSLESLFP